MPADAAGAKAVFRTNIDDYGEVWVNGEMPRAAGRPSPGCIQGFNMPNRCAHRAGQSRRQFRDRHLCHQRPDDK
jgi:hypothetical protein